MKYIKYFEGKDIDWEDFDEEEDSDKLELVSYAYDTLKWYDQIYISKRIDRNIHGYVVMLYENTGFMTHGDLLTENQKQMVFDNKYPMQVYGFHGKQHEYFDPVYFRDLPKNIQNNL